MCMRVGECGEREGAERSTAISLQYDRLISFRGFVFNRILIDGFPPPDMHPKVIPWGNSWKGLICLESARITRNFWYFLERLENDPGTVGETSPRPY